VNLAKLTKFQLILFVITMVGSLKGAWFEGERILSGNVVIRKGAFAEMPGSTLGLYSNVFKKKSLGDKIISFDIATLKCKDSIKIEEGNHYPIVVPLKTGGWNLYYARGLYTKTLMYLHIKSNGEFGTKENILKTIDYKAFCAVSIPKRHEAWFVSDKIYRLDVDNNQWLEFPYPEGWDMEQGNLKIFKTDDQKTLFITSVGESISKIQAAMVDMETHEIRKLESDKFYSLDIQQWYGHEGHYLMLFSDSLYKYNAKRDEVELLIDDFSTISNIIMQDARGESLYLLGHHNVPETGVLVNDLYVLDLVEKTLETYALPFETPWQIVGNRPLFFDQARMKIIALVAAGRLPVKWKPVIIDLEKKLMSFIPVVPPEGVSNELQIYHVQEKNLLLFSKSSNIGIYDLDSGELKNSIVMGYSPYDWSVIKGQEDTKIIGNTSGTQLCHLILPGRRQLIGVGLRSSKICYYPDKSAVFMMGKEPENDEYKFGEYHFDDNLFEMIEPGYIIPKYPSLKLYADYSTNQIIGFLNSEEYEDGLLQFIKPDGDITIWRPPSEDRSQDKCHYYDEENDAFWIISDGWWENKEWIIYKVSTRTYDTLDTFKIDKSILKRPINFIVDPLKQYLYILNTPDEYTIETWNVVIFDPKDQTVRRSAISGQNPTPCMILIPEKERLFLWNHFAAWCLDTKNFELIFGNSEESGGDVMGPSIKGEYNLQKNSVIVADLLYNGTSSSSYGINGNFQKVITFDLETGKVQNEITIPIYVEMATFSHDKSKIYFLERDENARFWTLYLDPAWEEPARIEPSTNYIQFGEGDECRFSINVKNEYEQDATAYIWLIAPDGTTLFFDGLGFTPEISGIPLTLPANLDVTGDFLTFTMPRGVPKGFYNLNAVFINDAGDRGPIGTWNFYVKD